MLSKYLRNDLSDGNKKGLRNFYTQFLE